MIFLRRSQYRGTESDLAGVVARQVSMIIEPDGDRLALGGLGISAEGLHEEVSLRGEPWGARQ